MSNAKEAGGKTVLITGASSGFGESLANSLKEKNYRVIGTSRQASAQGDISSSGLTMAQLDVDDEASVNALRDRLLSQGIIPDIVVLNAGIWGCASIEETTMSMARAQFETNFFGVHRIVRALMPPMRERKSGHFIFIGSLGAQIAVPFQGFYSASKAAIASYADTLAMEAEGFGIDVSLVEPGNYNTGIGVVDLADKEQPSVYEPQYSRALKIMVGQEQDGPKADKLTEFIVDIISGKRKKFRNVSGTFMENLLLFLSRILPDRKIQGMLMQTFKMPERDKST
ncbi:MAG: SDR family oxidoreductase [Pseudomonadota bacterium]